MPNTDPMEIVLDFLSLHGGDPEKAFVWLCENPTSELVKDLAAAFDISEGEDYALIAEIHPGLEQVASRCIVIVQPSDPEKG